MWQKPERITGKKFKDFEIRFPIKRNMFKAL